MIEVTIDTREQTPFAFPPELVKATIGTIKTGDYCITGDKGFAVERKSLDDLLGTISSGWERFQREIFRARSAGFSMPIVVEGTLDDVVFHWGEVVAGIAVEAVLRTGARDAAETLEIIRGIFRGDESAREIVPPQHNHFNLTPQFVLKRCGEIEHLGAHVEFCGTSAVAMAYHHLRERWNVLHGEED